MTQLLGDGPDLCGYLVLLKRVGAVDVGEPDCLAPTAIEDLTCRCDAITVVRFGVLRDLQENLGKKGGRAPQYIAKRAGHTLRSASRIT